MKIKWNEILCNFTNSIEKENKVFFALTQHTHCSFIAMSSCLWFMRCMYNMIILAGKVVFVVVLNWKAIPFVITVDLSVWQIRLNQKKCEWEWNEMKWINSHWMDFVWPWAKLKIANAYATLSSYKNDWLAPVIGIEKSAHISNCDVLWFMWCAHA